MSKENRFAPKKPVADAAHVEDIFINAPTKKLSIDVDADLHKRLKLMSTLEERSMRSIVEECLTEFLDTQGG